MLRRCLRLRRRLRRRCLELLRRPLWLRLRHLPLDCCGLLDSLLLLLRDKIRVLPRLLRFYLTLLLLSLPLLQPPLLDHVAQVAPPRNGEYVGRACVRVVEQKMPESAEEENCAEYAALVKGDDRDRTEQ